MRAIETTEQRERKEQKRRRWISIFMLGILVLSSVGYAFISFQGNAPVDTKRPKNGLGADGRWYIDFDGQQISFLYAPSTISNVSIETNITLNEYSGRSVYIDTESTQVLSEIGNSLGKYTLLKEACYGVCAKDLPEKNCTDSIIIWNDALEQKIYQREQCIFIEGDLRTVDAFLYRIFGVQ